MDPGARTDDHESVGFGRLRRYPSQEVNVNNTNKLHSAGDSSPPAGILNEDVRVAVSQDNLRDQTRRLAHDHGGDAQLSGQLEQDVPTTPHWHGGRISGGPVPVLDVSLRRPDAVAMCVNSIDYGET